jgi:hypothetical protein
VDASGQIHALPGLHSENYTPLTTRQVCLCDPQPVWALREDRQILTLPGSKPWFLGRQALGLITFMTKLFSLPTEYADQSLHKYKQARQTCGTDTVVLQSRSSVNTQHRYRETVLLQQSHQRMIIIIIIIVAHNRLWTIVCKVTLQLEYCCSIFEEDLLEDRAAE